MWFSTPCPAARKSRHLHLEALEDRTTPSGGSLDPTFDSAGFLLNTTVTDFADVLVQADGKVVAALAEQHVVPGPRRRRRDLCRQRHRGQPRHAGRRGAG